MNTPWGRSDHSRQYARGFGFVGTPGHGGVYATAPFAEEHLSDAAIGRAQRLGNNYFWEEDIAWTIPMWELREFWDDINRSGGGTINEQSLWETLSRWFPDYLKEMGVEPEADAYARWEESRHEDEMRAARDPDLVTTASGSWKTGVAGTVLVGTADGRCHLVTEASYDARTGINLLSKLDLIESDVPCG